MVNKRIHIKYFNDANYQTFLPIATHFAKNRSQYIFPIHFIFYKSFNYEIKTKFRSDWWKFLQILKYFYLDIDECEKGTFTCTDRTKCVNTDGSYNCKCKENYYENGLSCEGDKMFIYILLTTCLNYTSVKTSWYIEFIFIHKVILFFTAYCEKLEYKGFTFNKTNESTLSVSNEKCEKTGLVKFIDQLKNRKKLMFKKSFFEQFWFIGKAKAQILCKLNKKPIDEPASFDISTFQQFQCSSEVRK